MKPGLSRTLLAEAIRYLGLTQAGPAVVLHGAWMLLALATWQDDYAGLTRPLVRAYRWLGGADDQGAGAEAALLIVWGKLALVLYFLQLIARAVRGPRAPLRLRVLALGSGLVALLGYSLGFLGDEGNGDRVELLLLAALLATLAAAAVAWAVFAKRAAESLARSLDAPALDIALPEPGP
ncbi:MAG: hypothetical protein ABIW30_02205 [Arenimonas sp.]